MVYRFIDDYKYEFGLRWLLRKFQLSPNSYYNYRKNHKRKYLEQKKRIYEEIKMLYYTNNRIIGHRIMKIFLAKKGFFLSKTTVHKYMNRELHLHSVVLKRKPRYYEGEQYKKFNNLLSQNFEQPAKNISWCTDFTYVRLNTGKMRYNCTILDLYDRAVLATLGLDYINTELAKDTLKLALEQENPALGLILHSDQGSQFTSFDFTEFCKNNNITQSMSKAGCPYDNAPIESFYGIFKATL